MSTRVLMKYLESKDAAMHQQAKQVIKVCAERNKQGDPKYASLTSSMREQLRQVVGEQYWRKAEDYLKHFLQTKGAEQAKRAMALSHGGGGSGGRGGGQARSSSQQQQQPQQRPGMGSGGPMRSPPGDYVPQQRPMPAQSKSKAGSAVGLTSQQKKAEEKKREQEKALRQAKTQKGKAQQKGSGSADAKEGSVAAGPDGDPEGGAAAQYAAEGDDSPGQLGGRGRRPPRVRQDRWRVVGRVGVVVWRQADAGADGAPRSCSDIRPSQSCSILLSKDYREDIDIQREQKKLLFGDGNSLGKVIRVPPSAGNSAAVIAGAQGMVEQEHCFCQDGLGQGTTPGE